MEQISNMILELEHSQNEEQLFEKECSIAEKTQAAYMNGEIDNKQMDEISTGVCETENKMRDQFMNKSLHNTKTR